MATAGNFDKDNTDTIFNQDYNTIRSRVVNVLGLGSGTSGYGDSVGTSSVSLDQPIALSQWQNLRTDINKCYKHITGSNSTLGTINSTTKINAAFVNLMNEASNYIVTNKDTAFNTQLTLVSGLSSTQSTAWNGAIARVCTITWASADDMRNFFNAGGYINASLSHGAVGTGASQGKNADWATIIDANPNLIFTQSNYRNASANVQIRSAVTGTNYTSNYLRAWGHKLTSSSLKITVLFDDATLASTSGSGQGWIDENVTMSITAAINYYKSTDAVVSPTPRPTANWTDEGFNLLRNDPANAGSGAPPALPNITGTFVGPVNSGGGEDQVSIQVTGPDTGNYTYSLTATNGANFSNSGNPASGTLTRPTPNSAAVNLVTPHPATTVTATISRSGYNSYTASISVPARN